MRQVTSNRIDFIKEDQTSLLGSGHLKELTHHPGPLHKIRRFPNFCRIYNNLYNFTIDIFSILVIIYTRFDFFPHLSNVLLHQFGADHPDEARVCSVGHSTGAESLPCARWSKQQHTLRGLNAQIDKPLGLEDRRQYRTQNQGHDHTMGCSGT